MIDFFSQNPMREITEGDLPLEALPKALEEYKRAIEPYLDALIIRMCGNIRP